VFHNWWSSRWAGTERVDCRSGTILILIRCSILIFPASQSTTDSLLMLPPSPNFFWLPYLLTWSSISSNTIWSHFRPPRSLFSQKQVPRCFQVPPHLNKLTLDNPSLIGVPSFPWFNDAGKRITEQECSRVWWPIEVRSLRSRQTAVRWNWQQGCCSCWLNKKR